MNNPIFTDCICSSYDRRGHSVCGIDCPSHPPIDKCPSCGTSVAEGRMCFDCDCKDRDKRRPDSVKYSQKAYHHIIQTFQALEAYKQLAPTDKSCNLNNSACALMIEELRDMWMRIIKLGLAEEEHHNWYDDRE